VISYMCLPRKREHPGLLILFSALAIFLFSSTSFFAVLDPTTTQCADRFTESTQQNNPICLLQGTLLVFGAHATCTWLAVLIINLHLHTVWNSHSLSHRYTLVHVFCWGIPFALAALTVGLGAIKYEFGELCTVNHDWSNPLFFYPIAAFVFPAFLIHLCTVVYIGRISIRARTTDSSLTRRSSMSGVVTAIKIQWRALALALSLLFSVLFFWLFYFMQVSRLRRVAANQELLGPWSECLFMGGDQTKCANMVADELPSASIMIAAETVVSSMGIAFFLIFAAQRAFVRDWKELLVSFFRERRQKQSLKYLGKLEQQEEDERETELSSRTRVRLGMGDVALAKSPVDLGAVYSASDNPKGREYVYY